MFCRASVVARLVSPAFLLIAGQAAALSFPLPPPGEDVVGEVRVIQARYEDTFADIAKANDMGYLEMVAANPGVDPWLPGEGRNIVLPTRYILPPGPREGIVINLAEYRMYYYPKGENVVYTYPLGIGREGWGSPVTNTSIIDKIPNPAWYPPKSILEEHAAEGNPLPKVVPPGPDNPLGPFKFRLGTPGYLIHGSNKKFGIGMRVSHGCFRMLNDNVLELAKMAPVGTKVRIFSEPYKFGVSQGQLFLEAHTPLDDHGEPSVVDKHTAVLTALHNNEQITAGYQLDWNVIREVVAGEDGMPAEVSVPVSSVASTEAEMPF